MKSLCTQEGVSLTTGLLNKNWMTFFLEDTATRNVIVIAVVCAGLSGLLMWFRTQDEEHQPGHQMGVEMPTGQFWVL